jgi:hypothetical protein
VSEWTQQSVPEEVEDDWHTQTGASGPFIYRSATGAFALAARWPVTQSQSRRWYLTLDHPDRRPTLQECVDAKAEILPGVPLVFILRPPPIGDVRSVSFVETGDPYLAPDADWVGEAREAMAAWLARVNGGP